MWHGQLHQMTDAPADDLACADQVAAFLFRCTQHSGDALGDGGFLSDDEVHVLLLSKFALRFSQTYGIVTLYLSW